MFGCHHVVCDVRGRRFSALLRGGRRLPRQRGPDRQLLDLPSYRQLDWYSCGFVAALTVVQFFRPHVLPSDILAAVRPTPWGGCTGRRLVQALRRFGVIVEGKEGLDLSELFRAAEQNLPVIVSVRSAFLGGGHWAVIRGIDRRRRRVYLANYGFSADRRGLPWGAFTRIWLETGCGLVCTPPPVP